MTVATLRIVLRVVACAGTGDKRRQLRTILETLHKHFNVSVAEGDAPGGPDQAVLIVAAVGRARRDARETLERVADAVAAHPRAEVLQQTITEV